MTKDIDKIKKLKEKLEKGNRVNSSELEDIVKKETTETLKE